MFGGEGVVYRMGGLGIYVAGGYEDTDGYCIVSGERLHSEIPRLLLVNFWTSCYEVDD